MLLAGHCVFYSSDTSWPSAAHRPAKRTSFGAAPCNGSSKARDSSGGKNPLIAALAWVAPVPWANLVFTRFLSACSLKICQRELTSVIMILLHSKAVFSHPLCPVRRSLGAVGAGDDKWPSLSLVWPRVTSVLPSWLSDPCPPLPWRPLLAALLCCLQAGLSHLEAVNGPDGERSWTVQCLPFCPMTGSQDCEWKKFSEGREEKAVQSLERCQ